MRELKKIVAIVLVMVMMSVSSVYAADSDESSRRVGARSVNLYSENNRHFTDSYYRKVQGVGYIDTYLDAVMNIYYYYEEGVYAEIAEYSYVSSTAKLNGSSTTCNYYTDQTRIHDGSICAVYGINGVMYRCHLSLDEWGDSGISEFGLIYEVD